MRAQNPFRPIAEPVRLDQAYDDNQCDRLFRLIRERGPWPNVLTHSFKRPEDVMARFGPVPEGYKARWEDVLVPIYRGILARNNTCLYPEIEDCFYNPRFLDLARDYWSAAYARPEGMLFNIQGPCDAYETPHFDSVSFRGISISNAPIWLTVTMAKSGLFQDWRLKKAQVIAWFYRGQVGGGFTYWPDGPTGQAKRLRAPMWNDGVIVQNEAMYHRADDNGPVDQRGREGLTIQSGMAPDPERPGDWQIVSDGRRLRRIAREEVRVMVHWGCEVYADKEDLARVLDHSDDLSIERVLDMFIVDLRGRGIDVRMPGDPLSDVEFISLLTRTYEVEAPRMTPDLDRLLDGEPA